MHLQAGCGAPAANLRPAAEATLLEQAGLIKPAPVGKYLAADRVNQTQELLLGSCMSTCRYFSWSLQGLEKRWPCL